MYVQYVYVYQLYIQYVYVYQLYIQYVYVYQLYTVCICISAIYMYTDMYHVRLLAHMYCSFVIVVAILSPFTLLM